MKKIILAVSIVCAFVTCKQEGETNPEIDDLNKVKQELMDESSRKDSTINSFMQSLNDIEDNLATIREKQKIVSVSSKDVELQKTQPERIVEDISAINELLEKNRKTINSLNAKLKKLNMKSSEFEKMIARLNSQIEEKDKEITGLKEELERKNTALKTLFSEYNDRVQELGSQEKVINTAYYAFGTMKELKDKGVLTKEGGFIGLGKNARLSDHMNKDYFTKVDIMELKEIPLNMKKAKVITSHPADSYKIEGEKKADKLVITNPAEFWSISKYLVVVVE